jgi:HSP20 family molecular chaperone IbpA
MSTQLVKTNRYRDLFDEMFSAGSDWFVGVDKTLAELSEKWDTAFEHFHEFPTSSVSKIDDNHYAIDVDVKDFEGAELSLRLRGDELLIDGEKKLTSSRDGVEETTTKALHQRFLLADVLEVKDAVIRDGTLHIELACTTPIEAPEKKLEIR